MIAATQDVMLKADKHQQIDYCDYSFNSIDAEWGINSFWMWSVKQGSCWNN